MPEEPSRTFWRFVSHQLRCASSSSRSSSESSRSWPQLRTVSSTSRRHSRLVASGFFTTSSVAVAYTRRASSTVCSVRTAFSQLFAQCGQSMPSTW